MNEIERRKKGRGVNLDSQKQMLYFNLLIVLSVSYVNGGKPAH